MRKKFATLQASPHRLLSLLLMQTFVALVVPFVDRSSASLFDKEKIKQITGGPPLVKTYQLMSACNSKYVQMKSQKIDALGRIENPFTHLKFESDPTGSGKIWIRSATFGRNYLCFSRKGRLTFRPKQKIPRCMFMEELDNNFIKLRSAARKEWYVGFNKKGNKVKGYAKKNNKKKQCFKFLKIEYNPNRPRPEKFVNSVGTSLELDYHHNR